MMRLLLLGDAHLPRRAQKIPEPILSEIEKLTKDSLFDYILFTGDLIESQDFIKYLKPKANRQFLRVLGNMDYYGGNKDAPLMEDLVIEFPNNETLLVGLTHGAQIQDRGNHSQLEDLALENSFNILISGHTHKEEIFLTNKGILLLNPGSLTGAWSFLASKIPSFIQLIIQPENLLKVILYQLKNKKISKSEHNFRFENGRLNSIP